jgi:hypothetical protein
MFDWWIGNTPVPSEPCPLFPDDDSNDETTNPAREGQKGEGDDQK